MLTPHRRALIARIAGLALAFAPALLAGFHVAQTAVNIPGGGWTSTCLVQETVAVVIGAPARRDVRQLIHEVQQLLQDPGGDP